MPGPLAPKRTVPRHAVSLRPALQAMMLTAAFSVAARADERAVAARGGLEAKLEYCKTCHGLSAQGYRGYFPMPRLAGLQSLYLENQLRAYIERRRTNAIMGNVAKVLSPPMISALAAYFINLDPKPIGGGAKGITGAGQANLHGWTPRLQCACMLGLSWQRGQGTA